MLQGIYIAFQTVQSKSVDCEKVSKIWICSFRKFEKMYK